MREAFSVVFEKLNIEPEIFDQIVSDDGTRQEIVECLFFCMANVKDPWDWYFEFPDYAIF